MYVSCTIHDEVKIPSGKYWNNLLKVFFSMLQPKNLNNKKTPLFSSSVWLNIATTTTTITFWWIQITFVGKRNLLRWKSGFVLFFLCFFFGFFLVFIKRSGIWSNYMIVRLADWIFHLSSLKLVINYETPTKEPYEISSDEQL